MDIPMGNVLLSLNETNRLVLEAMRAVLSKEDPEYILARINDIKIHVTTEL